MQSFPHCDQYYPYALKTTPCSGNVHALSILLSDGFTSFKDNRVCDGHMSSYIELGNRPNHGFTITKDEVIGTIIPETIEGKPKSPAKET